MRLSDILSLGSKPIDIYEEGCDNCRRFGTIGKTEEQKEIEHKQCIKCLRYYSSDLRDRHERIKK